MYVSVQWEMERLQAKTDGSTHLVYTGLSEGLEHLKIETRWSEESFESVKVEYEI
jgi:hypothetical protein